VNNFLLKLALHTDLLHHFIMSDIRKRTGAKGTTYQVRYPNKASEKGYAYATFATIKEARDFRENSAVRSKSAPLSTEIRTVEQGLQKWLDVCAKEGRNGRDPVTTGTMENYEYRAAIIRAYDWNKPLHELTAPDIVEFRSWLLRKYSRAVSRKALTSLHSMVRELMTRGILAHDFVSGITIQNSSRYDEPVAIPSERDIHKLLAAADRLANSKNPQIQRSWRRYRPMLYLAVDSGMRPQEYVVLARENVLDNGVMVDRALERMGEISVTKTPAGRRFIELSPGTLDMVSHYAKHHAAPNKYDLVFPTETGRWILPLHWLRRGFYNACIEADLVTETEEEGAIVVRPKYRAYDLRHFFASMLIEQRVSLKRLQYLMGHEDIRTTLQNYGHLIERMEAKAEPTPGLLATMGAGV
jgi:integrase